MFIRDKYYYLNKELERLHYEAGRYTSDNSKPSLNMEGDARSHQEYMAILELITKVIEALREV